MRAIGQYKDGRARFFAYARERHATYLRRLHEKDKRVTQWTDDGIISQYRFTNVFRELDKTTLWFNKHVRGPLRDKPEVLLATVLFRMLNRIEVGEAVFLQSILHDVGDNHTATTAFDEYLEIGDPRDLRRAITAFVGKKGPFVTGAYIISTPPGYSKLDGALKIIDDFAQAKNEVGGAAWRHMAGDMLSGRISLEAAFDWLREFPYLGTFHSYEIVTDLRHTKLLHRAPDVNSWANIGPGCRRGMNRIMNRPRPGVEGRGKWGLKVPSEQMRGEMVALLALSRDATFWPQWSKSLGRVSGETRGFDKQADWPRWELREVEHTLCEFDKWERVYHGEGKPRGRFP